MKAYYERRAPEYDEWYEGLGRFDGLERPFWNEEVRELERVVASLRPARTLDVACGTGFLTRHLRGEVVGLDTSRSMLEIARSRMPEATFLEGDARELPFGDGSFDRVFTGHFYGHLEAGERERFLAEARRVGRELVVVDATERPDRGREEWQERILNDGSRWHVYKRYFTGAGSRPGSGAGAFSTRAAGSLSSPREPARDRGRGRRCDGLRRVRSLVGRPGRRQARCPGQRELRRPSATFIDYAAGAAGDPRPSLEVAESHLKSEGLRDSDELVTTGDEGGESMVVVRGDRTVIVVHLRRAEDGGWLVDRISRCPGGQP